VAWLKRHGYLIIFTSFAAVVLLVPFQTIHWDGGFESKEFSVKFTNTDGRPMRGVTLKVITQAGCVCYLYPINEFLPKSTPISDADGVMVFHHVGEHLEFGGREHANLIRMRFGETSAPEYACLFLLDGQEVYRINYADLRRWKDGDRLPKVKRSWKPSEWARHECIERHEDWNTLRLRLFDGNGDGVLDREERIAASYFAREADETETKEITFPVAEHLFVISQH
jgi:hypothetical protein